MSVYLPDAPLQRHLLTVAKTCGEPATATRADANIIEVITAAYSGIIGALAVCLGARLSREDDQGRFWSCALTVRSACACR